MSTVFVDGQTRHPETTSTDRGSDDNQKEVECSQEDLFRRFEVVTPEHEQPEDTGKSNYNKALEFDDSHSDWEGDGGLT